MPLSPSSFDQSVPDAARTALALLAGRGALTAAELARASGGSEAFAAVVLSALAEAGLLRRASAPGGFEAAGGLPLVLGIDLGGTKMHIAIAGFDGTILSEHREPTDTGGADAVIARICRAAEQMKSALGLPQAALLGASMGCPGVLDPATGRIDIAPNIPGFGEADVAGRLAARLGLPLRIENDVNLAALGERAFGVCRDVRDFAFVALGTGIGMGLVIDGQVVRGARGSAGEIALLPIGTDPFDPGNYRLGPLETAIGSVGIVQRYRARGGAAAGTVRALFDEAAGGSAPALATLDETADILFQAFLAVKALVDPRLIVLGGSIGLRPELLERVQAHARRHPAGIEIVPSALGNRAVLAGAINAAVGEAVRHRLTQPLPPAV